MTQSRRTKRQHYVSRFYLAAWADDSSQLRQYDLERKAENSVAPQNAALKKWLYELSADHGFQHGTQEVERILGDIESSAANAFRSVVERTEKQASGEDLSTPSTQVLLLSEQRAIVDFILTLKRRHPRSVEIEAKRHKDLLLGSYSQGPHGIYLPTSPAEAESLGRDLALASLIAPLRRDDQIMSWAWRSICLPEGAEHHFITSDRPVVLILDDEHTEVLGFQFALGPRILITMTPEKLSEIVYEGLIQTHTNRVLGEAQGARFIYSTPGIDPVAPTERFVQELHQYCKALDID